MAESGEAVAAEDEYNPFTDGDLQSILHEEASNSEAEGWKFVSRSELVEVWRKVEPDRPVHLIKGFIYFPGIPPKTLVELITNLDLRRRWDRQFPEINVLENHKHYKVVYWLAKMPPAVADRDVVQYIRHQTDEATNTTTILYLNAPQQVPIRRGIVRAETIRSGVIIRPDKDDPNSTRMAMLFQTDFKGWIPHFIVNAFTSRAPEQWRASLEKFYHDVYTKEQQQK